MGWFILAHIFSTLLALIGLGHRSETDKDLEILILHHQLNILARKQQKPIKPTRTEKLILAVLVHKLKRHTHRSTQQLREIVRILSPQLCSNGIVNWCGASGPTRTDPKVVAPGSALK